MAMKRSYPSPAWWKRKTTRLIQKARARLRPDRRRNKGRE